MLCRRTNFYVSISATLVSQLFAQTSSDTAATYAQPPVTVSATRLLPRTAESMGSAVRIDGWSLRRLDGRTLDAVLEAEGGMFVRDIGGSSGVKTVSLRNASAAQTIVHLNGMRLNHPQNGLVDLGLYPAVLFDAVEVVRGGQSSLFGPDATAGAIVLGVWPSMDDRLTVGGRVGSFGDRGAQLRWDQAGGMFATTLRFGIDRSDGDFPFSWLDADVTTRRVREGASHQRWHAAASALVHGMPWGRLEATVIGISSDRGSPGPVTNGPSLLATLRDHLGHVIVRAVHEGEGSAGWEAGGTASYQEEFYEDLSRLSVPTDRYVLRNAGGWFQGRHVIGEDLVAGAGVDVSHAAVEARSFAFGSRRWTVGVSLSVEWLMAATGLKVLPMLRWDLASDRRPTLSPRIAAEMPLVPGGSFVARGSVGLGTRTPNFNELYWQPGGDPTLRPERVLSADAGVRLRTGSDDALTVDANVFTADTRDRITGWPPRNLTRTIARGGDVNALWKYGAIRWWANGTYAAVESVSPSYPGRQVPYVPRWLASTGADIPVGGVFTLSPVFRYVSRRFTTLENLAALSLAPALRVSISGDCRFTLAGKAAVVGVAVENLFDVQGSSYPGYPMPGRSMVLRASVDLLQEASQERHQ